MPMFAKFAPPHPELEVSEFMKERFGIKNALLRDEGGETALNEPEISVEFIEATVRQGSCSL